MSTPNTNTPDSPNLIGQIIAYENGELDQDEILELFQGLVDSGLAWSLQGSYGRTAVNLIECGYIAGTRV